MLPADMTTRFLKRYMDWLTFLKRNAHILLRYSSIRPGKTPLEFVVWRSLSYFLLQFLFCFTFLLLYLGCSECLNFLLSLLIVVLPHGFIDGMSILRLHASSSSIVEFSMSSMSIKFLCQAISTRSFANIDSQVCSPYWLVISVNVDQSWSQVTAGVYLVPFSLMFQHPATHPIKACTEVYYTNEATFFFRDTISADYFQFLSIFCFSNSK